MLPQKNWLTGTRIKSVGVLPQRQERMISTVGVQKFYAW